MTPENDLVLRDSENWASRSHRELYDSVHHNNDPGQAGQLGSEWAQFGTELTESAQLITKRVTASESGWTGESAEGARAALRKLVEWITKTAETAVDVGNRVATQGRIMETARSAMPEPSTFDWEAAARSQSTGGLAGLTASTADVQAANDKARAAHEQAVAVMVTMEQQSREIDATTPVFTPPFNPVTGELQEPPQPVMFRSPDGLSLSGAAPAPTVGTRSTADTGAPAPGGAAPGGVTPAAACPSPSGDGYTAPPPQPAPGTTGPAHQPTPYQPAAHQPPPQQPAAYQPYHDGTAAAAASMPAASGYQAPTGTSGYGGAGPTGAGYSSPAEHRPQQYGMPPPWQSSTPQNVPKNMPRSTSGTGVPGGADPRSAVRPPVGPSGFGGTGAGASGGPGGAAAAAAGGGGGGAGGGGGGGVPRGGFSGGAGAGHFATGQSGGAQMQPGSSAGVTQQGRGPVPIGGHGPGAASAAGGPAAGGPMGGAPGAGRGGDEDKEHRSASYLIGGNLFEVPGENLPPSVIGGAKPKKKQQPNPEQSE